MDIKQLLFAVTKNEKLVVAQTDNGVQPLDPPQDVTQDPTIDYGAKE